MGCLYAAAPNQVLLVCLQLRAVIISVSIKVADEANTKAEKAQYIAKAFAAFAELLGNLHEERYIYVQDVRSAAYGYGGKTQEYRSSRWAAALLYFGQHSLPHTTLAGVVLLAGFDLLRP